jgi:hypothetical protein
MMSVDSLQKMKMLEGDHTRRTAVRIAIPSGVDTQLEAAAPM